jgi:pimeloyl-ACP methyl ester carboxylesterase
MAMSAPVTCDGNLKQSISLLEERFEERSIAIGGHAVSYRSCGRGPFVVLLHGIGSGAASWLHCALLLEKDAQVIAWNAPGYGNSTSLPDAQPDAADYALRLEAFLQALGITDCLLVGHSLGAMMASAYVAAGYGRASRLLLISPAQGYGSDDQRVRGRQIAKERLAALETLGIDGMADRSPARMLSAQADDAARTWVRWNMQRLDAKGYTQAVHMLCGDDIHCYVPAGVPGAVVCGGADVVTTPLASRALAEQFDLPFHLIDDAGHACYIEQPDAAAAVIRQQLYKPAETL